MDAEVLGAAGPALCWRRSGQRSPAPGGGARLYDRPVPLAILVPDARDLVALQGVLLALWALCRPTGRRGTCFSSRKSSGRGGWWLYDRPVVAAAASVGVTVAASRGALRALQARRTDPPPPPAYTRKQPQAAASTRISAAPTYSVQQRQPRETAVCDQRPTDRPAALLSSVTRRSDWLGSRVVSVLDSGAEGPGSNRSRNAVG